MKKTFIVLSLLYTAHNLSMTMTKKLVAAVTATSPVTIPGSYHYYNTVKCAEINK